MLAQLFFFFVILFFNLAFSQPDFLYQFCLNNGNFTRNSTYQTNLNRVLSSLPSNASASGFFTASIGRSPDNVTATSLCRGDAPSETCRQCVNDSIAKLPQLCPLYKSAIGWYDNCLLKFSNESIAEDSPSFYMWSPRNFSSSVNSSQYNQQLGNLMSSLRARAARGGPVEKFATGEANVTSFLRIYGLVQCTPDLSEQSCSICLESATGEIPTCCDGKDGGRVIRPSCNIRYESYQFYTPETPNAPPPTSDNSSSNSTTGTTGGGGNTTRTVIIIVVPTVSVILAIIIFFFIRKRRPWRRLAVQSE